VIYAGHLLACRLESLISAEFRRLAAVASTVFPGQEPECADVGDGVALWLGEGSPVNLAVGLGMRGPVPEAAFQRLESFYHDRGAPAVVSMCPLADPSLLHLLGERGWKLTEFEHVLVLELDAGTGGGRGAGRGAAPPPAFTGLTRAERAELEPGLDEAQFEVRVCLPEEREIWGRVAAHGFSDGEPESGHEEFGRIMAERDDAILVLAWVDGEPAGTGALVVDGGVGWLSGDSTMPRFRRRGIQQAIQRHRIEIARDTGCDLAVTESSPGSQSQRNMERVGFRIVYTHVEFARHV